MGSTSSSERRHVGRRRGWRLAEVGNRPWLGSVSSRKITCGALLLASLSVACGDDSPTLPTAPSPPTSQVARPGQPTVMPGNGMLTLSWTAVPGAASYTVQWRSGSEQYAEARRQVVMTPWATKAKLRRSISGEITNETGSARRLSRQNGTREASAARGRKEEVRNAAGVSRA